MKKFEKGDVVVYLGNAKHSTEWRDWAEEAKLPVGVPLKVNDELSVGENFWIRIENYPYWQHISRFEIHETFNDDVIKCIALVVRRPSDYRSVMKFLKEKGVDRRDVNSASRVINIHLKNSSFVKNGQVRVTYNGQCGWGLKANSCQRLNNEFLLYRSSFDLKKENILNLRTKPSVKKTIELIEYYINR